MHLIYSEVCIITVTVLSPQCRPPLNYYFKHIFDDLLYCVFMQVSSGQDWIVFHDELQQHIAHSQNFIFAVYFPYVSVAFHFLFAAPSKPTIHYPNTAYEVC